MKHINLSSWKLSLTDWTELNYIHGGLADEYADIANVKGNYVKKSDNLIALQDVAETTINGITYKVENGVIYINGTATATSYLFLQMKKSIPSGTYSYNQFKKNAGHSVYLSNRVSQKDITLLLGTPTTNTTASNITTSFETNFLYFYIINGNTIENYSFTPMLVSGSTAPTEYQPGSTSGLYIEDNVNDELIPINDPSVVATRNTLILNVAEAFDKDEPTDVEDVR